MISSKTGKVTPLLLLRTCRTGSSALLREFLDSTQVTRRRNIAGRHRQDNLRLRRETLLDLLRLSESGIARGKEKSLFHHRLKIDKYRDQHEQHGPMSNSLLAKTFGV